MLQCTTRFSDVSVARATETTVGLVVTLYFTLIVVLSILDKHSFIVPDKCMQKHAHCSVFSCPGTSGLYNLLKVNSFIKANNNHM